MTPPPLTILVADDEPGFRQIIDILLRRAGYRVLLAADGPTAAALIERERPDLLLLDEHMPGLHGSELMRWVRNRAHLAHTPIVMHTATSPINHSALLAQGAQAVVAKPCHPKELIDTIARTLGVHASR